MDFFRELFNTSSFPPRWSCGQWTAGHGWLHILSDLGIWSAYFAIPIVLTFFILRRRDLPFQKIFFLFGSFILLCGITHLMDATIFWWPAYRLAGLIKLITAIVSWITVFALVRVAPSVLAMRSPHDLQLEIAARQRAEEALYRANAELEQRVDERTRELTQTISTLHEQRELFRTTLASIGEGVVVTNLEGQITFLNGAAEKLTGWLTADVAGQSVEHVVNIVDEQTRQSVDRPTERMLCESMTVRTSNPTLLIARDGAERPVDDIAAPIRDEQGVIVGAVLVFRDVSEQRQRERERDARERVFRTLAEWIPQLAWMANPDGHVFWYNRRWYDYTGMTFEQAEGWGWQSVVHPQELSGVLARWKSSIETGQPFDMAFTIKSRRGEYRTFLTRVMPVRDDKFQIVRWFGTNTDITELKQAREALAASEKGLRLALDAGSMGVWDWNLRTNTVTWSDRMESLHGLAAGMFGGRYEDVTCLIHPDDRLRIEAAIQRSLQQDAEYDVEFRNVWPDGSLHWTAVRGKVLAGDDGQPEQMIGVCMDITDRKRAEQTTRFLAETNVILTKLGQFESTLQNMASIAVPHFADWVTIDLLDHTGEVRRVAVAHVNPKKVELRKKFIADFHPIPPKTMAFWKILRHGPVRTGPGNYGRSAGAVDPTTGTAADHGRTGAQVLHRGATQSARQNARGAHICHGRFLPFVR